MKKKILSILLALTLCLGLMPATVLADETGGTGASGEAAQMPAYSSGSGTINDPWLISSVEDLQLLASTINDGSAAEFDADCTDTGEGIPGNYHGYYFKQTTDLDLSSIENWDPIGYSGGCYFAGHYDGGGYTISNATSTGKNDDEGYATAGIFGWVAFGSVKNLTVKNADFFAEGKNNMSYAGGVLAVAYSCTVENCSVYNSKIESRRDPNDNSNYAGGITGIAFDSSFEKCASVKNTIRHGSFGGGFIGSLDNGDSNFTNCYVANCIVTGCSDTASNSTLSGGFLGASMDGDAILNSCFVYDCVAQPDTTSKGADYFAIFTPNTQYGEVVAKSHVYYYGANNAKVNDGELEGAVSKTVDEFADGTVAGLLGVAFAQGKHYPVFATDPADYTEVDAAIAKANALNKDNYKDFSAVEAAVNAVVRNKNITEQSDVDAMAGAIEGAISNLAFKPADYTAVDAAIEKAKALNENDYKDFSAVKAALEAVVRDKNITEQPEVDAMAKAIEDAIAALVKKPSSEVFPTTYPVTTPDKTENGTVTVSTENAASGSIVTITVKPDSGYMLEDIIVIDSDGKELSLTNNGNGEYTFTMPSGKVEIKVTFAEDNSLNLFRDVPSDAYYFEAVRWAVANNVTNGTSATTFSPEEGCTRAQAVTFLWRIAGKPAPTESKNPFTDVKEGTYYYNAVLWAVEKGITNGTSATTFSPEEVCTRAQAVTFLWRAAGKPAPTESKNPFTDVKESEYYYNAVLWAVEKGITNGTSKTTFAPDDTCTRAQTVTFLFRASRDK